MSHILSQTTLIRRDRLRQLKDRENAWYDLQFIKAIDSDKRGRCVDLLDASCSQLRQDLFVLAQLDFKQGGFFVEFGATDGHELSNSYLLEKQFGWRGILAEPAWAWHDRLHRNRPDTVIDTRCVWKESGSSVRFAQTPNGINSAISSFVKSSRKMRAQSYDVETVSLNDLLEQHQAPAHVDYLSIDTEGSEFDILQAVDFDRWSFGVLTVEHNYEAQREDIHALLTEKGYTRVLEPISRFDDWYVNAG